MDQNLPITTYRKLELTEENIFYSEVDWDD